ncbi:MAG: MarR family transcriptional regulator [Dehalococcoidia bacterium]|nr:MarR family transcriptional regulator [Dehalococcoidia bacterium]
MTEPNVSARECASLLLRTIPNVMRRLAEVMRQQRPAREDSLHMGQVQVMASLSSQPSSLRELASLHHVTPSTMSRAVEVLVQRGWVNRADDPSDRRQIILELTGEGRVAFTAFRELTQEAMARILDQLSVEKRGRLYRGLEVLAALPPQEDAGPSTSCADKTDRPTAGRSQRRSGGAPPLSEKAASVNRSGGNGNEDA